MNLTEELEKIISEMGVPVRDDDTPPAHVEFNAKYEG